MDIKNERKEKGKKKKGRKDYNNNKLQGIFKKNKQERKKLK